MSKTVIPSDTYAQFSKDFARLKKMNLTGFIKWVQAIRKYGYEDGWGAAMDAYKNTNGGINIDKISAACS